MPLDNAIDGAGAAPGSYQVLAQKPDSLVQANGTVIDAETVQAIEKTFGVWFQITVPKASWAAAGTTAGGAATNPGGLSTAEVLISQYAALIQALGMLEPVVDIQYLQLVNRRGLFTDNLVVTVGTPDGLNEAQVTVPLDPKVENTSNNAVLATYQRLLAVAAAT